MTSLDRHMDFVRWLTGDVRAICQVVQGLVVHDSWVDRYGTDLDRRRLVNPYVTASDMLDLALSLSSRHLAISRSPQERVIGCCREFALLTCAILRNKGIPARCRCGFATYMARPGYFEDHWVCEYWDGQRWLMVDPQIDAFQQSSLENWAAGVLDPSTFNPLDLTAEQFVTGGRAWLMCRRGEVQGDRFGISCDPSRFGLKSLYGQWFARGNMLRDFAALNKVETVPYLVRIGRRLSWDSWRLVGSGDAVLSGEDLLLLDKAASLAAEPDGSLAATLALYGENAGLQVPTEYLTKDEEDDVESPGR